MVAFALAGAFAPAVAAAFPVNGTGNANAEVSARVDAVYYDDGLKKNADYDPAKVTNIYERVLELGLFGAATPATDFRIVVDPTKDQMVERATITWHGSSVFTVEVGKTYVNAGGWEQKTWDYETILVSPYVQSLMPWITEKDPSRRTAAASAPAVGVAAKLADFGVITLQAVDDVVFGEDAAASFSKSHKQLAPLIEFVGLGETVKPLLQLGAYDTNHSNLATVGVAVERGGFVAHADFVIDRRNKRPSYDHGNVTEYRSVALDAAWRGEVFDLFGKLAALEVTQPGGQYGVDHKGNMPGVLFDDNAVDYELGVRYKLDGEAFKPYFALIRHTGRFLKDVDEPRGATEAKQDLGVQLGVSSHF